MKLGTDPIFLRGQTRFKTHGKMGSVPNFTSVPYFTSIRRNPLFITIEDDQRLRIAGDGTVIDDDLADIVE